MVKILGYETREIMFSYRGWFVFHMESVGYVKMFVFVLIPRS